ncbi:hypothetical protein L458_05110 [Klebsiella pneumoniae BIDMC 22]|nr:hypothetical protein L458_05110 [Klebsiella pneumoniae BIDMC 22]
MPHDEWLRLEQDNLFKVSSCSCASELPVIDQSDAKARPFCSHHGVKTKRSLALDGLYSNSSLLGVGLNEKLADFPPSVCEDSASSFDVLAVMFCFVRTLRGLPIFGAELRNVLALTVIPDAAKAADMSSQLCPFLRAAVITSPSRSQILSVAVSGFFAANADNARSALSNASSVGISTLFRAIRFSPVCRSYVHCSRHIAFLQH